MSVKAMKWAYDLFEIIDIPPAERAVLLALCWDHTDANGCFPSQERISLLCGYRERKVRDLLNSLEAQGFIERRRVKTKGKYSHTSYQIFGRPRVASTGRRGPTDYRHKNAGRNHRQTGADYRGIYNIGEPKDVIDFPSQKREA